MLVFFALDDLLGLINGGGIFSFFAAAASVHRAAQEVEVDGAALRTGFMALCAMAAAGAGVYLDWDLDRKWVGLVFMASAIAGGFVLDAAFDQRIESAFMARHGYRRCGALDRAQGTGKGRVWLDGYVLGRACPAA